MDDVVNFYIYWCLYFCLLIFAYFILIKRRTNRLKQQNFVSFLFLLLVSFLLISANITSDYYNYQRILADLETYMFTPFVEPLYGLLAQWVDYDYYFFRLIIMLPTFILLFMLFRYSFDATITVTLFVIVFSYSFTSVIRSSLGDTIFWCGLLSFVRNNKYFLLGVVFIVLSFFCHKSMCLLLIPCIGAFLPLKIKTLNRILFLTIPAILIGRLILPLFLNKFGSDLEGEIYFTNTVNNRDFTPFVISLVINSLLYAYWGYLLYTLRFLLNSQNKIYRYLYKFLFLSLAFFLFLFFQEFSFYVYERFFAHLIIPICILSSLFLLLNKKAYSICILLLPIYILFQNLYIYMFLQRSGI